VEIGRRPHRARCHRETRTDPARSETPSTPGNTSHGNREIPRPPGDRGAAGRTGKSMDTSRSCTDEGSQMVPPERRTRQTKPGDRWRRRCRKGSWPEDRSGSGQAVSTISPRLGSTPEHNELTTRQRISRQLRRKAARQQPVSVLGWHGFDSHRLHQPSLLGQMKMALSLIFAT